MYYRCEACLCEFHRDTAMFACVKCGSEKIVQIDDEFDWDDSLEEDEEDEWF